MGLLSKIRYYKYQHKWNKNNRHNFTNSANFFPISQVNVGRGTYGNIYALIFDSSAYLRIGNYCSIAPGVKFIVAADHFLHHISTYPFRVKIYGDKYEGVSKGDVIIEDDVWIGENALILSGVTIGQGAVIAAGAVVDKSVPPYAVVGGVPAKIIKYRFAPDIIKELLMIDYSKLEKQIIEKHLKEFYLDVLSAQQIRQMDWLPRKEEKQTQRERN